VKVVVEIPERVADLFRMYPKISRRGLEQQADITQHHARIFAYLHQYGKIVAHYETRLKPKSGKTMKALVLADMHIPYHDDIAIKTALNWGLSQNPDLVVLNGDTFDCYTISSWKTDPLRADYGSEVRQSIDIFKTYNSQISKCKSVKEKIFICGNHEDRLRRELWSGSKKLAGLDILTIPNIYQLDELGWKYIDNAQLLREEMQPFKLGKLTILHGHEVKVNYSVVNIPRIYYQKCLVNIMVAHYHRSQENIERKLDHSHDGAWSMGALCKLSQEYAPHNNWNHGCCMIEWDSQGDFSISNKKIINGKVL